MDTSLSFAGLRIIFTYSFITWYDRLRLSFSGIVM
jgi:hypothetical protein